MFHEIFIWEWPFHAISFYLSVFIVFFEIWIEMNTDQFFAKEDSSDDSLFYEIPRLVTHIDDNACMVLKGYYRSLLKDGDAVLDLMSSWA